MILDVYKIMLDIDNVDDLSFPQARAVLRLDLRLEEKDLQGTRGQLSHSG